MTRHARFFLVAMALLAAAGAALALPRDAREVRLAVPLEAIPTVLGPWRPAEAPPEDLLPADPRAAESLLRGYTNGAVTSWVAVGFYPKQTEDRRPATGSLVFPGSGWTDLSEEAVRIPLGGPGGGTMSANLVLVRRGERRVAILYWYQLQGSSIDSDHLYRAALLWSRVVRRRADGALIRVATPVPAGGSSATVVAEQAEFLRAFLPALWRSLPR